MNGNAIYRKVFSKNKKKKQKAKKKNNNNNQKNKQKKFEKLANPLSFSWRARFTTRLIVDFLSFLALVLSYSHVDSQS